MGRITANVIDFTDGNENIASAKEEVNSYSLVSKNAYDNTEFNEQLILSLANGTSTEPFVPEFIDVQMIPQQDAESLIDEIDSYY